MGAQAGPDRGCGTDARRCVPQADHDRRRAAPRFRAPVRQRRSPLQSRSRPALPAAKGWRTTWPGSLTRPSAPPCAAAGRGAPPRHSAQRAAWSGLVPWWCSCSARSPAPQGWVPRCARTGHGSGGGNGAGDGCQSTGAAARDRTRAPLADPRGADARGSPPRAPLVVLELLVGIATRIYPMASGADNFEPPQTKPEATTQN